MYYRMVGYESLDRAALPGHFGPKPFRPGTPQPKSFVFYTGTLRTRLHSLVIILTSALVSKRTVSEYHNQMNVLHSKGLRGKIERNTRKYHIQRNCQEV